MKKTWAVLRTVLFAVSLAGIASVFAQNEPATPGPPGQTQPNTPKSGLPDRANPNGKPEQNDRRPGAHTPDATPTPTPNTPDKSKTPETTPAPVAPPNAPSGETPRGS